MNKQYPQWIDEYAKAVHHAFSNMVPCSWGPLDGFALYAHLNGLLSSRIVNAIDKVREQNYSLNQIAESFSCPSSIRAMFFFVVWEYQNSNPKNKEEFRKLVDFFNEVLHHWMQKDVWAYESNIVHRDDEIKTLLQNTPWTSPAPGAARELGKLYTSLSALVFALYKDFFPQDSNETYGPYDASAKFGENTILLIKHFPKIKPVELWLQAKSFRYHDVKIIQVYQNVKFACDIVGMHSRYEGDLIQGLVAYAVMVDGQYINSLEEIESLTDYIAEVATEQSTVYERMSQDELKTKFLEWVMYQFYGFFKLAGLDWRPDKQMVEAVRDKEIPKRFELETFPTFDEYITSPEYEIYWLKDLYK